MAAKPYTAIGGATEPDERIRIEWGQSLAECMDAQDLTIKGLVAALEALEPPITVTRQAVESWLTGKTSPRPYYQQAIGTVLNMPPRRVFPLDSLPRKKAS